MRFDAIVIGGSFAGLEAATYIARAMKSVCVIDDGLPRNRFATYSHGYLSRDGATPAEILDATRAQMAVYPSLELRKGRAVAVGTQTDGFAVHLNDDRIVEGRRLVLAFGVTDVLPSIPGLAERWGKTVNHCPYCHGFEFGGQRLGVLYSSELSMHQATLIPEWGPTTLFLNGATIGDADIATLHTRGVTIVTDPVKQLVGAGSELDGVELSSGEIVPLDALYIAPPVQLSCDIAQQLGCALEEGPLGPFVRTDELKTTTVPNVWAAGDISRPFHNVTLAAADGVIAASAVHRSLLPLG